MKRYVIAAAMFMGTAAFAQVDAAEVGPEIKEEAKEVGSTAKENVRELGKQTDVVVTDDKTYKADAFQLDGKVQRATRNRLTVTRENLPQASLDIRRETEVMIDGKKAEARDLKEGMDVHAHFQLEGRESVAVKVEATSMDKADKANKAMGGSGEAGKKDHMKNK